MKKYMTDEEQLRELIDKFDKRKQECEFLEASIEFVNAERERVKLHNGPCKDFCAEYDALARASDADQRLYRLFTLGIGSPKTLTLNRAYNAFRERLLVHHERES